MDSSEDIEPASFDRRVALNGLCAHVVGPPRIQEKGTEGVFPSLSGTIRSVAFHSMTRCTVLPYSTVVPRADRFISVHAPVTLPSFLLLAERTANHMSANPLDPVRSVSGCL